MQMKNNYTPIYSATARMDAIYYDILQYTAYEQNIAVLVIINVRKHFILPTTRFILLVREELISNGIK